MKEIILDKLNNTQKQNFFISTLKKRWWHVIFDIEKKQLSISTVRGRKIIFNFSSNWKWYGDPYTTVEELNTKINSSYEEFHKWYEENTIDDDEYGFTDYPLDSWEGFLDSPMGTALSKELSLIDFWFWGESISFDWVSEEDTSSKLYAYCILDLLWLKYTEHNNPYINNIVDCGELVFPCNW